MRKTENLYRPFLNGIKEMLLTARNGLKTNGLSKLKESPTGIEAKVGCPKNDDENAERNDRITSYPALYFLTILYSAKQLPLDPPLYSAVHKAYVRFSLGIVDGSIQSREIWRHLEGEPITRLPQGKYNRIEFGRLAVDVLGNPLPNAHGEISQRPNGRLIIDELGRVYLMP